jgi:GrpB-like predicted nucleotidyltransferase (UPF0157 family)
MAAISIRHEAELRVEARTAFEEHRAHVVELLPGVGVEHVGSTSIPGALTKGDVDLLVRVEAGEFDRAVAALSGRYSIHQPENWTPTYASFVAADEAPLPVGLQLVVVGSPEEGFFVPFREALAGDPALLAEYNALKRRHDGDDYERYTKAKGEFVERVLLTRSAR